MTIRNQRGVSPPVAIAALLTLILFFFIVRGLLPAGENAGAEEAPEPAAAPEAEAGLVQTVQAAPAVEKPAIDPQLRSRLSSLISQGRTLVRNGRARAMRIPEAEADAGLRTEAARSATQQWSRFVSDYSTQVNRYGQQLTQMVGGMGFDHPAFMVYQELTFMVNRLQTVGMNPASTTNIPMKYMRESAFDEAARHIDGAAGYLRELR